MTEDFSKKTTALKDTLNDIPDDIFQAQPDGERWSVGQILEHLYRSEYGLPRLFEGPTEPVEREPAEKIALFEQAFLASDKKYEAPERVEPKGEWEREELLEKFYTNRENVYQILSKGSVNLEDLSLAYDHPIFGPLTGLEWLAFVNIHARRHHRQIKDVLK